MDRFTDCTEIASRGVQSEAVSDAQHHAETLLEPACSTYPEGPDVNFIKHHFLPDSNTYKSILLVAFILTVRIGLTKIAANLEEAESPDASSNLVELPNSYFKSTLGEHGWQPSTFTMPRLSQWNALNVKPTSAEFIHERALNAEAVSEALLRLQLGHTQVTESSALTDAEPTMEPDKKAAITFADGIRKGDN
jgi:hypothetical protein